MPLSRWSSHELATQAVSEGLVDAISSSTLLRWLHADAIKPWRYGHGSSRATRTSPKRRPWSLTSTPRVVGGVALGPSDYVIAADEK